MDLKLLTRILQRVTKPGQYLGNEVNAVHKDFAAQKVRVALVFPDLYEMGMSHMGLKILYEILNGIDGVVAERCFAPAPDLEAALRENKLPLFSLESKTPLSEFDIIGITLPYELTYTNIVNIIDLAGIPLWQKDRKDHHPILLGGGTGAYNPEPIADFFDAVAIGDGEELVLDLVSKVLEWKKNFGVDLISKNTNANSRVALLDELKNTVGMYIPSFFDPKYNDDNTLKEMTPLKSGYTGVQKRIAADLNAQPYPTNLVLPNIKLIHDRIGIEIQRGCTRMCRFCQAGYIDRPTRQRSPERVLEIAEESLKRTGIDEISLLSLSAGDYQTIVPTLRELNARYASKNVSISVPATRTETLTPELIAELKKVRMSGFTIAPEAGSERMRRVINKGNKVENLMQAARNAFSAGYRLIKFYYMCGLPFEHDEDVIGIAKESAQALAVGSEYSRAININVSVSSFVPKPFTPFQWDRQISIAETKAKHTLIKQNLKDRRLNFKHHSPEMSFLEGVFARGDRRLSAVLVAAHANGCRFDEWSEHFDYRKWEKTFAETGVDLDFYVHRERGQDELFPWDHLFSQMLKPWLWDEREAARLEAYVADCSIEKCAAFCGACDFKTVKNKIYVIDEKPLAAKKGNREWYGRFGDSGKGTVTAPNDGEPPNLGRGDPAPTKLRIHFSKTGLAALIGHSELMNHLKRAILRTQIPVAYSEGFHPQMKLAMGYALPLGLESECESFDLILTQNIDIAAFTRDLGESVPQGLSIQKIEVIDLRAPSIYSVTQAIDYEVSIDLSSTISADSWQALQNGVQAYKNGKDFVVVRKRDDAPKKERQFNLRDFLSLPPNFGEDGSLKFTTRCDPEGSLKPTEVLSALAGVEEINQLKVRKVGVHYREM